MNKKNNMRNNNLSVTVGIPVYNEESNIANLLQSVISQKIDGYILEKIIVVLDGCTDNTISQIKKIKDKRVVIVIGKKRFGKAIRMNQLFKLSTSEILVQFDGDVILKNSITLKNLIKPFKNNKFSLVHGVSKPIAPKTFIERLAYFGFIIWEDSKRKLGGKANRYKCIGPIRAFSKSFYKSFLFPKKIGSAEDTYCFYYAVNHGFKIGYVSDAVAVFRLASTLGDYFKQMARYLNNSKELERYFDKNTLMAYQTLTFKVKLISFLKRLRIARTDVVLSYILIQLLSYVLTNFAKQKNVWDVSSSTKRVIKNFVKNSKLFTAIIFQW